MCDYIRQIIAEYIDMYAKLFTMGDYRLGMMKAKEILLNQESADMVPEIIKATDLVPVVRCKNCVHWKEKGNYCYYHWAEGWKSDDFCSCGREKW